jgi:hypothetical protein
MILVKGGKEGRLRHPIVDPFWNAFYAPWRNMRLIRKNYDAAGG